MAAVVLGNDVGVFHDKRPDPLDFAEELLPLAGAQKHGAETGGSGEQRLGGHIVPDHDDSWRC